MAEQPEGRVIPVAIEDEVKQSYMTYAMSVIVSRALPDVRDGLKPVHRRILYSMGDMGLWHNKPFKKSARIVGDILGKYHPHGDQSIYDAQVRLAQDFSMRYPVVNGQGNFGSVDGDPPAAMRYTEARLTALAEEMLRDIKKETVDFAPNYDDSTEEPSVLPGAIPYLLVNGATGIAVGMATNMPPHNLREIVAAICAYIDNNDVSIEELMQHVKGPDFPTGGIIYGTSGIRQAYLTGKGQIPVRARFTIDETKSGRDRIIISEIPYQVNKANLIIRIADLVRDKRVEGITDLRDESDRDGMRIVIILKKGTSPKIILNHLFTHTQLQSNFNVNALALVDRKPQVLNLKDMIVAFVKHRQEVIERRTRFDLRKAEEREHILIGLKIALDNIDEVIRIIKESSTVPIAKENLMQTFELSDVQAQAILDMRLQKLTSLETKKIIEELEEIRKLIAYLRDLLAHPHKILELIKEESQALAEKFGDDRRTEIVHDEIKEINIEDLIQKQEMVVIMTRRGYIKRIPSNSYRTYKTTGVKGASSSSNMIEDDVINQLFIASTHDYILFLSSEGNAYYLKVLEIPEASRSSRGTHVKALLQVSADEDIQAVMPFTEFSTDWFVFMATARGMVKKVVLHDLRNAKTRGIRAITMKDGDKLRNAMLTSGEQELMLITRQGKGLRIDEQSVRPSGRTSQGVRGINLRASDELSGSLVVDDQRDMLIVNATGKGKRIRFSEFNPHGRGTGGQRCMPVADTEQEVVGVISVEDQDEVVFITHQGKTVKLAIQNLRPMGAAAQGYKLVDITAPDMVVAVDRSVNEDDSGSDPAPEAAEPQVQPEEGPASETES
ncbi:DNA topoisomerase (ATP-hydrolyzing) subunit A [Spirochaeta africana]|uniref:DNA gyrase subunit A n=1 Tax=Spirochaeta africana (strain ATCC 700263 / DSM 8902 / Z-7692) TaxID=889378 RepID=H9UMZ8_SPIAZ|nr:DNA topoisomerase (ATP-hydrolyzing) subunit A [Spirochaeta africana]AFG38891.1 DNA gyrase, A subunit [Spirochaeta africana DSM 8902]